MKVCFFKETTVENSQFWNSKHCMKSLMSNVKNQALPSMHGGSLEIMLKIPLKWAALLLNRWPWQLKK